MRNSNVRKIVVTAMLSALASILMFISFSVPVMPSFIKADVSEMPALIASFALGPVWGGAVCLIKNIVNAFSSTTGFVGEFANFILGLTFVLPAGFIYKYNKTRTGALIASVVGAAAMGLASLPINYFVTYPVYARFMPIDAIINMYEEIMTNIMPAFISNIHASLSAAVDPLFSCLLLFNVPFTFLKGILCAAITFVVYKRISFLIKGKN